MPRLDDFFGDWRLRRRSFDRRAGETGRLGGTARFTPSVAGATQDEAGVLRLPGRPPMTATRSYLWSEAGPRLIVRFSDGGDFHSFDASGVSDRAGHVCGDDLYQVRYDFRRWPRWRTVWRVRGPRKDLVIVSAFAPLAPAPSTGQKPFDIRTE